MNAEEELSMLFKDAPRITKKTMRTLERAAKRLETDLDYQADLAKSLFVTRILGMMQEKKVSQNKLALRVGRSRQYVSKLLSEDKRINFTIETMMRLAMALDSKIIITFIAP